MFSVGMTAANAATALAVLRILRDEPWRSRNALDNAAYVRRRLGEIGVYMGQRQTPAVPVLAKNLPSAFTLWKNLTARVSMSTLWFHRLIPPVFG